MVWILAVALGIVAILQWGPKLGVAWYGTAMSAGDPQITHNPATWPTGDPIWDMCHAAAIAEGANRAGSNPDRLNNPGDLSDDAERYGYEEHSGSKVTKYPDKQTGWGALYDKFSRIVTGASSVYPVTLTWTEVAQKWAGDWERWLQNVTAYLKVDPDSTPAEYVAGAGQWPNQ
jgi:hypothetical protein